MDMDIEQNKANLHVFAVAYSMEGWGRSGNQNSYRPTYSLR